MRVLSYLRISSSQRGHGVLGDGAQTPCHIQSTSHVTRLWGLIELNDLSAFSPSPSSLPLPLSPPTRSPSDGPCSSRPSTRILDYALAHNPTPQARATLKDIHAKILRRRLDAIEGKMAEESMAVQGPPRAGGKEVRMRSAKQRP